MNEEQKQKILEAWDYCDDQDKSTEFMLQYMADTSGVDYDDVVDYIVSDQSEDDRVEYYKKKNT